MKRSWLGLVLLVLLLAVGILSTWGMGRVHEPVCRDLEAAARACLAENWPKAAYHVALARRSWENWELLRASLTNHGPTEEIDALFAVLEIYGSRREDVAFAALAREMAEKIEAVGDAHSLLWKNIL